MCAERKQTLSRREMLRLSGVTALNLVFGGCSSPVPSYHEAPDPTPFPSSTYSPVSEPSPVPVETPFIAAPTPEPPPTEKPALWETDPQIKRMVETIKALPDTSIKRFIIDYAVPLFKHDRQTIKFEGVPILVANPTIEISQVTQPSLSMSSCIGRINFRPGQQQYPEYQPLNEEACPVPLIGLLAQEEIDQLVKEGKILKLGGECPAIDIFPDLKLGFSSFIEPSIQISCQVSEEDSATGKSKLWQDFLLIKEVSSLAYELYYLTLAIKLLNYYGYSALISVQEHPDKQEYLSHFISFSLKNNGRLKAVIDCSAAGLALKVIEGTATQQGILELPELSRINDVLPNYELDPYSSKFAGELTSFALENIDLLKTCCGKESDIHVIP